MTSHPGKLVAEVPRGFSLTEATQVLVGPGSGGEGDRRANLVVRTAVADDNGSDDDRIEKAVSEIRAAGGEMIRDFEVAPFSFHDERPGRLVSLVFAFRGTELVQRHAIRVDGDHVTTLTYTADKQGLDDDTDAAYLAALRSATNRA